MSDKGFTDSSLDEIAKERNSQPNPPPLGWNLVYQPPVGSFSEWLEEGGAPAHQAYAVPFNEAWYQTCLRLRRERDQARQVLADVGAVADKAHWAPKEDQYLYMSRISTLIERLWSSLQRDDQDFDPPTPNDDQLWP